MSEITHDHRGQVVSADRLRAILIEQNECCFCAPPDHDPSLQWNVAGECPEHGEIWHPGFGTPHPDDDDDE